MKRLEPGTSIAEEQVREVVVEEVALSVLGAAEGEFVSNVGILPI